MNELRSVDDQLSKPGLDYSNLNQSPLTLDDLSVSSKSLFQLKKSLHEEQIQKERDEKTYNNFMKSQEREFLDLVFNNEPYIDVKSGLSSILNRPVEGLTESQNRMLN